MPLEYFHPLVRQWFVDRFGEPTDPQRLGWPSIAAGRHTLIAAPTGSGKTLSAFLVCLDRLYRAWLEGALEDKTYVVYVSPLKALSSDIHRNLQVPLEEIAQRSREAGAGELPIRAMVRTGDTPAAERQAMLRHPPHILVTTPESLYLLLTASKSRELLRSTETVIVDEIHALARDKRGSHLALSLERLEALCPRPPVRIGLSATQRPIDDIARFLVGTARLDAQDQPDCAIIDEGHVRQLDLAVEVPPSELSAVCSNEQWVEIYERLKELIDSHRSTLVFVNTRRLAERAAHQLRELYGDDAVASHHGSLSRDIRQAAEERLKAGQLRAIVATASLEMGIDIGYIDLVCQIGSPRSIATFLQRVGRAGHSLHKIPKGRLFPLTRDELLESLSLIRAVRKGHLDRIEIPEAPLDILAQQIVASVACEPWDERELLKLCRGAWPYRNLSEQDYESVVHLMSQGIAPGLRRGAHLHRDRVAGQLRARRGARMAAITSGGAIPDTAQYRVMAEPDGVYVGTVDEDFAVESLAGDVFLLGNTSWRILHVRGGEVLVADAHGAPPSIPFWLGEAPGRTRELSADISGLRSELGARLAACDGAGVDSQVNGAKASALVAAKQQASQWLQAECGACQWAGEQAIAYVEAQWAAIGIVPTLNDIVFERFFDESGGMQLVIHAPWGSRVNRAWGLSLRKRFCRSFDFELQASATDNGIVLSLGPQHSFPIESLFRMLNTQNAATLLEQALIAAPMFQTRFRWNVTRSLCVMRQQGGRRLPPHLQRMRSDDALAAVFPEQVGCLENHSGDVPIPDHPLVRQTMHDCLHEAMDLDGFVGVLADVERSEIRFHARDTREPSPFSYELLNANPYAFLDPAPLEERRTRAVATRRVFSADDVRDLARLDPEAIALVRSQSWPVVRDADELHDALIELLVITDSEAADWAEGLAELTARGRASRVPIANDRAIWFATERWPFIRAAYGSETARPAVALPPALMTPIERTDATVEIIHGRIQCAGPTPALDLANHIGLPESRVAAALEALEGRGVVLRGHFTAAAQADDQIIEWCERRLLARIHRLTLDGLRQQIQPVDVHAFLRFLTRYHRLVRDDEWGGPAAVREVLSRLQGFEMPAGVWEHPILSSRIANYDPAWLDHHFMTGEVVWGRLRSPAKNGAEAASTGLSNRAELESPKLNGSVRMGAPTRAMPLSLMLREDLPLLLPANDVRPKLRSNAQVAWEVLADRGALFFSELKQATEMLPSHLEEALRELAALGLVTADGFSAVRHLARRARDARRARQLPGAASGPLGRWSLFPGRIVLAPQADRLERWCRQLLARYGVVFRELLTRESSAPTWHELVPIFRRLEMRGEIRGGRFVTGVAGEQYATTEAIEWLRNAREPNPAEPWLVVSAADPLNLVGIVTAGPRVAATHRNALILQAGRCVASLQSRRVEFHADVDLVTQWEMRQALSQGRRRAAHDANGLAAPAAL